MSVLSAFGKSTPNSRHLRDERIRSTGQMGRKMIYIDSTGSTWNSESESENEMRIQCKHQKTW